MNTAERVQILDETVCNSHRANTSWRVMNQTILPRFEQNKLFNHGIGNRPWKRKKSELKSVKLRFKIDLVSYPYCVKELGKYIFRIL